MKNLLQKSLKQLTLFAFIVFALSVPSYFLLVDWIWLKELDENNKLIADRIENEFNEQNISNEKLEESIQFWNEIQPVSKIEPALLPPLLKDSVYTIRRQHPYTEKKTTDRFRGLKTRIKINEQYYLLVVETNVEETEETVAYIAMITLFFFMVLVVGFWILNRRLSKKLWQPFQDTLQKLKSFQLNNRQLIEFKETDTTEFAELNTTLDKLIRHSVATYTHQKEFTENAAHELQTPLAILKNKVDILLQSEELTEKQYHIAEEMNKALIRSARINKNLLLLAKIENSQFNNAEVVRFDSLLQQSLETLQAHFTDKKIQIKTDIHPDINIKGNNGLAEVLISNLLVNAIRYTAAGGTVEIALTARIFAIKNPGNMPLHTALLFKRFSSVSANSNGSGLGLAIVQEIVRFHGWQVTYHFEEGKHCFMVTF